MVRRWFRPSKGVYTGFLYAASDHQKAKGVLLTIGARAPNNSHLAARLRSSALLGRGWERGNWALRN
jgi:hypothetical protein